MVAGRAVCVAFWLAAAAPLFPQDPPERPLWRDIQPQDWGIPRWSDIKLGQIGIIRDSRGGQLQVYCLLPRKPETPRRGPPRSAVPPRE